MKEVQLTEDEYKRAKDKLKQRYEGWVLGSIKQTYAATKDGADDSSPLAAFILTSCAIDFLAGFYCGIESFTGGQSGRNYKAFVKKYMPQYDPVDVYIHVRCRLAHNYTIGGNLYLTHNNRSIHYPRESPPRQVINFENFLEDFEAGAEAYFNALNDSPLLRENFEKRVNLGLVDAGPLRLSQKSTSA